MDVDLILFDLDGTIVHSGPRIVSTLRRVLAEDEHRRVPPDPVLYRLVGPPLTEALQRDLGLSPTEAELALKRYRELTPRHALLSDPAYPEVLEAIAALSARHRLGVATSKPREDAEAILDALGLRPHLTVVAGAAPDDSGANKAHLIRQAVDAVGVPPGRVAMVGDSTYDMAGAVTAGVAAVGAGWGYWSPPQLVEAGASRVVMRPAELRAVFGG